MYYIGTKEEVDAYNQHVTSNIELLYPNSKWADPIQSSKNKEWAIAKHKNYQSTDLRLVENLSEEWNLIKSK